MYTSEKSLDLILKEQEYQNNLALIAAKAYSFVRKNKQKEITYGEEIKKQTKKCALFEFNFETCNWEELKNLSKGLFFLKKDAKKKELETILFVELKALQFANRERKKQNLDKLKKAISHLYGHISNTHNLLGNEDKALKYHFRAIDYAKENKDSDYIQMQINSILKNHKLKEEDKLKYLELGYKIAIRDANNHATLEKGNLYSKALVESGNLEKALRIGEITYNIAQKLHKNNIAKDISLGNRFLRKRIEYKKETCTV